jgi:hypothetical protein
MKFTVVVFTLVATATAAHAQKRAEHRFCEALGTLKADIKRLDSASPDSNMKEHRAVLDQIKQDAKNIEKDAAMSQTEAGKQLVQSSRKLAQEARSMPDDMTLKQARSKLGDDIDNVRNSARQLAAESGCPMTEREGRAKPPTGEGTHAY